MIKVENIDIWGFDHAIRGMRNPMNSWAKSDSYTTHIENPDTLNTAPFQFVVGEKDLELMKKLYRGGPEHRKYMRQIFVSMDILAPLYWWKEFDTYKVGTVANSCSTMHKIHEKKFTLEDFSCEHLGYFDPEKTIPHLEKDYALFKDEHQQKVYGVYPIDILTDIIDALNSCRTMYLRTKDKGWWWQMIQLLPSSYNQRRTVTMNYENVVTIIKQRTGHKLDEWNTFVDILKGMPYVEAIAGGD